MKTESNLLKVKYDGGGIRNEWLFQTLEDLCLFMEDHLNTLEEIESNLFTYNHDKVYEVMKSKLSTLPCWTKYKSYTASNNIPMSVRDIELV